MSTIGYIYCFKNESMPGIYKIGMTVRTPRERLAEANKPDAWRPPTPFEQCFAKKVHMPLQKESILHKLLDSYRIHPRREYFKLSEHQIKLMFDLMDDVHDDDDDYFDN